MDDGGGLTPQDWQEGLADLGSTRSAAVTDMDALRQAIAEQAAVVAGEIVTRLTPADAFRDARVRDAVWKIEATFWPLIAEAVEAARQQGTGDASLCSGTGYTSPRTANGHRGRQDD